MTQIKLIVNADLFKIENFSDWLCENFYGYSEFSYTYNSANRLFDIVVDIESNNNFADLIESFAKCGLHPYFDINSYYTLIFE